MFATLWKKIILGTIGSTLALGGAGYGGYKFIQNKKIAKLSEEPQIVTKVIDGDTIKVQEKIKIRLIGIDAPEKGECYYEEATDALKELVEGELVELRIDISKKDKYKRLLRHIILLNQDPEEDNIIVSDYLVRNGFAKAVPSPPDNLYRDLLSSAQEEAKREERGIWKECLDPAEAVELREKDAGPTDPNCIIKGNISEKAYGKTYLIPGCDNYNRVKIDTRKGEAYFCTEEEAEEAGFRKATNCP